MPARAAARLLAWIALLAAGGLSVALVLSCAADDPADSPRQGGELSPADVLSTASGGETTAYTRTRNAFSLPARNLSTAERRDFQIGDSFLTQNWVTAPASTEARDGLGPTSNAQSCSTCHARDGRARPPLSAADPERGLLLHLSLPEKFRYLYAPSSPPGSPVPDPVYGTQLQDRSILGVPAEGFFVVVHEEVHGEYADGQPYTLLRPTYVIDGLAFGELHEGIMISPRIARAVFGVGLLEAIAEAEIRALADPDDRDGDGISGRANDAWDVAAAEFRLGRFGWKASTPSVRQQAANAFHADIGITSSLFADENCLAGQDACAAAPDGAECDGEREINEERLEKVTFYNQTLAPPAARDYEEREAGAVLLFAAGCQRCHTPRFTTGPHVIDALAGQNDLPVHRPAAARPGRRARRRSARLRRVGLRVADGAAVGNRPDSDGERSHAPAARRART